MSKENINKNTNKEFDSYFLKIYQGRWASIKAALIKKNEQTARKNLFFNIDVAMSETYLMDPASEIVANALQVKPTDSVLDMCAAPGGKSLILAEQMSFNQNKWVMPSGELICNEISEGRRDRLTRVLTEYIPKDKRLFLFVKGLDGNQYGLRQPGHYDRILADVPCSGERHLLENQKEFEMWSEKRTKNISVRQYSLLSAAWLAVKTGGRIVYSTCSISPLENDGVVSKLVKKRVPSVLRLDFLQQYDFLEETEFGYQILPDTCGYGPMYFSILEKN